jgi:predicted TIM-barrel fold metal-dependent hydrolase
VQLTLSGVFERFPRLKFVMTEAGCAWVPPLLAQLDTTLEGIRAGATGEIRYGADQALPRSATEYFRQNVWMGVSQPGDADVAARHQMGLDRFMWGSDYPHDEGTHPYTREHLRARFSDVDPAEVRMMLSENAAALYGFDLAALRPLADQIGPSVAEVQQPIDHVPEKSLERISSDMDTRAIK